MNAKVSSIEWFLMISFALFIDFAQFVLDLLLVGIVLNRILSLAAFMAFYLWLKIKGVKGFGKYIIGGGVGEMIPIIGAFPLWTGSIIGIMIKNKTKSKVGRKNILTKIY